MERSYVLDPELQLFVCRSRSEHTEEFLRLKSDLQNKARLMVEHVRARPKPTDGTTSQDSRFEVGATNETDQSMEP